MNQLLNKTMTSRHMNRREFLQLTARGTAGLTTFGTAQALFPINLLSRQDLEAKVKEKVEKSTSITPFLLRQIKALKLFRDNNISLVYDLFKQDSDSNIGSGSMNYNKDTRIMDLGIDNFDFITDVQLFIANIFSSSKKYKAIIDLPNLRSYAEFDEAFVWKIYREGMPIRGNPDTTPRIYELIKRARGVEVKLEGAENMASRQVIHNPLSAAFEILNRNCPTNFEMVTGGKHTKNVSLKYTPFNGSSNFKIVESDFEIPIIKNFKKVYALCYNSIPLSGYLKQNDADLEYIRGQLSDIRIDGKSLLKGS